MRYLGIFIAFCIFQLPACSGTSSNDAYTASAGGSGEQGTEKITGKLPSDPVVLINEASAEIKELTPEAAVIEEIEEVSEDGMTIRLTNGVFDLINNGVISSGEGIGVYISTDAVMPDINAGLYLKTAGQSDSLYIGGGLDVLELAGSNGVFTVLTETEIDSLRISGSNHLMIIESSVTLDSFTVSGNDNIVTIPNGSGLSFVDMGLGNILQEAAP